MKVTGIVIILLSIVLTIFVAEYSKLTTELESNKAVIELNKAESNYYNALYNESQALNKEYQDKVNGLLDSILNLEDELLNSSKALESVAIKKSNFKFTAYDLSYESCGKYPSDNEYGMTRTGLKIVGPSFDRRICAVDPKVVPLHSILYVEVKGYPQYNGVYFAEDTGGGVKGSHVDLFINNKKEVDMFGIQYGTVYIMKGVK